ncbi:MAG: ammonium transporter [Armatimonadetes bacterium]|nr:ammonium transporter [Armatimonadota bacterium]
MFKRFATPLLGALALTLAAAAHAQTPAEAPKIDTGDTAWILASTALVLLMTPGLALFYGGMVRQKNALSTILQSFICLGVISLQWILFGYTLAFAEGTPFIGGLQHLGLNGISFDGVVAYAPTIPSLLFIAFQMMFAIITPALITGAFAERVKFSAFLVFVVLWATLVYDPLAHWVWGAGGWLGAMGALDFAGGTVVHISSGISALVFALYVGRRRGYPDEEMRPHNLTMTLIGTGLLWFGWFGFNAGSALGSGSLAAVALLTTNTAAAAGALAWMFAEWKHHGQPTALGAASGAVAGLVGITPGAGFVSPMAAIFIGLAAGVACYLAVLLKNRLKYDDSLDTFGVHGIGGILGALMTGIFVTTSVNSAEIVQAAVARGPLVQLGIQAVGVVATVVYSAAITWILLKLIDVTMGLRVKPEEEEAGLDLTQHGETAYHLV